MKNSVYLKNMVLIVEIFLVCVVILLMKTFVPGVVLPRMDVPVLTGLCVVPMMIGNRGQALDNTDRVMSVVLAGLTFSVLPMAAGWSGSLSYGKLLIAGSLVFGITDLFYTSVYERLRLENGKPLILFVNGFLLFLASQCFQNIF